MSERLARYAEDGREQNRCQSCGRSMDECSDAEKVWYPQRVICHYSMDLAAANWKYDTKHADMPYHDGTFPEDPMAWAKERSTSHPYHYRDGVKIWLYGSDLNPEDQFL